MSTSDQEMIVEADIAFWNRPLSLDFKGFFTNLAKATTYTAVGSFDDAAAGYIDSLEAVGLKRSVPQLAGALLKRAIATGVSELIRGYIREFDDTSPVGMDAVSTDLEQVILSEPIVLDRNFLEHPGELPFLPILQARLEAWLRHRKVGSLNVTPIAARLPYYFVWGLHREFQQSSMDYEPLVSAISTPVADAWRRMRTWNGYYREFKKQLAEPIFGESFSLPQIYVWPRASYLIDDVSAVEVRHSKKQFVVDLKDYLDHWLAGEGCTPDEQRNDAIRVISGDPGSGKSSFARMYVNYRIDQGDHVIYVPLHRLNVQGEFGAELETFCTEIDSCPTGLMNSDLAEKRLLVVLDGLDELSKQGAIGATIAAAFVEEVIRKIANRNATKLRVQVIVSGRPIAVQDIADKFRGTGRVVTILPYCTDTEGKEDQYVGRPDLLRIDLRQEWWRRYGDLTARPYDGLPVELDKPELLDLSSQPLLNFLLAMVYQHEGRLPPDKRSIDFAGAVNRNEVYDVLLKRVYERDWDPAKSHKALGKLPEKDFRELLEEMALTAWHGADRTTTASALKDQCAGTYLEGVLAEYEKKCSDGVGSLFTAFYFRKSERIDAVEPTFEFTHKSFGEYLTALRLVDGLDELHQLLQKQERSRVRAFTIEHALVAWLKLFGPTRISTDLLVYLKNEMPRRRENCVRLEDWQSTLMDLLRGTSEMGMPCHKIYNGRSFQEMQLCAANAELAILAIHGVIADVTDFVSDPDWLQRDAAESLIRRNSCEVLRMSLHHLSFNGQVLTSLNVYAADFRCSTFVDARLIGSTFSGGNFERCKFESAIIAGCGFQGVSFDGSELGALEFWGNVGYRSAGPSLSSFSVPIDISDANFRNSGCQLDVVSRANVGVPAVLPDGSVPGSRLSTAASRARRDRKRK